MKTIKRICTMLLVLAMVLSLTIPAMAASISFSGGAPGATYSAYRLLNATDGGDGKFAYSLNDKYAEILKAQTGKTEQADIVDYISKLDADGIRDFADSVYAAIKAAKLPADATTTTDVIENAEQGYYLIAETALGSNEDGADDTWALVMIDTVGKGDVTVITKESAPTVDKEVYNVNDSTSEAHWGEHADYDLGDKIPFRITARVSGQFDHYKNYWYQISDTMDPGLTYNGDLVIKIGDVEVTEQFDIDFTENSFTATADLKKLTGVVVTHNSVITATYTCTLNENAKIGKEGNENEVVVRYQNDPYAEGDPTNPGETPPDVNIVFTYTAIVNKIDSTGKALEGAGFTLYKWNYAENTWVPVGEEVKDTTVFNFSHLDKGIYKLVETTVPEGYNKAEDIEFHIHPTYDITQDPPALIDLKIEDPDGDELTNFTVNISAGTMTTSVVNNAGVELPSTGGMGTTLFYVFGGLMVAAALVLLITKKRMSAE